MALGLMQTYGEGSITSAMAGEAKGFVKKYEVLINENNSLEDRLDAVAGLGAILTSYDSSADYWRMKYDGTLVYDGSGWLRDEEGKYISIYGYRTDSITEDTVGAANITQGLLNILYGGTTRVALNNYSKLQQDFANGLINTAGKTSNAKLDMNSIMSQTGNTIAGTVFRAYYSSTMDAAIASFYNVDLIFNTKGNWNPNPVPGIAAQRYAELLAEREEFYQHRSDSVENALLNKYITTVNYSNGTSKNLLKITQNNPYASMLLNQNNPIFLIENTPLYNEELYHYGCNFMSTIAVPQLLTGDIFDAQTVTDIWNWAVSNNVIASSALVYNSTSLVRYALQSVIGEKDIALTITNGSLAKPSATSMRIAIKEQYNPSHFVLIGTTHQLVYNPWPGLTRPHERYDGIFLQIPYKGR
jgi:hypothetical protein